MYLIKNLIIRFGDLMNLKFHGNIPSNETLFIRVNDEEKTLDSLNSQVNFVVNQKKRYKIEIEQQLSKSNRKPIFIFLFFITAIIQGVFNILLMNTDTKWYRNIRAYCFKMRLIVDMQDDTTIHLTYTNSKYDEDNKIWKMPDIKVEPDLLYDVVYDLNLCDFKNQYFNYVKRIVSITTVIIFVFSVLLYIAIFNLNIVAIIFVSALILGIIALVIALSISQYKKLQVFYQKFLRQNEINKN